MAKRVTKKPMGNGDSLTSTIPAVRRPAPPPPAPAPKLRVPTQDQIRQRAYEIFLRRKGGPGDPHSDWVQAETELKAEFARQAEHGR